ncbi:hypothetical protein QN363_19645, partial [Undibacterium sp. CCC2.1]|uniref:hypothetical protein n=1 Tax=Undibacterium sp. CCC2.1 TaxID=3048604 RepID=UPI002B232F6A
SIPPAAHLVIAAQAATQWRVSAFISVRRMRSTPLFTSCSQERYLAMYLGPQINPLRISFFDQF